MLTVLTASATFAAPVRHGQEGGAGMESVRVASALSTPFFVDEEERQSPLVAVGEGGEGGRGKRRRERRFDDASRFGNYGYRRRSDDDRGRDFYDDRGYRDRPRYERGFQGYSGYPYYRY